MMNAIDLRPGMIIVKEGELFRVMKRDHVTPGKGNAFVRYQLRNLRLGNQAEVRYNVQDKVEKAHLDQRTMEYLYKEGDQFHFMDTETYEQTQMSAETIGDNVNYLLSNMQITVDLFNGSPVGIEFPKSVELKVVEADPAVKRATASAQTKNAKLETGMNIRVPAFVEAGDTIRVDTETGEYLERA